MNDTTRLEAQYCAHNYHPLPVVLKRDEGVFAGDATRIRDVLDNAQTMRRAP